MSAKSDNRLGAAIGITDAPTREVQWAATKAVLKLVADPAECKQVLEALGLYRELT